MNEHPLLSIVITSYTMERFKDICDLFDSIKNQTLMEIHRDLEIYRDSVEISGDSMETRSSNLNQSLPISTSSPIEVIFVAERSRELYEKVKEYGERIGLPGFKVLWNDGEPGLSAARNLGIMNAKGDIIGFVDDDVVLFPNWAEEVVKSFDDDSIIGVTGPALPLWEDEKSMSWFPEEFCWIISCTAWFDCNEKREVRNA